MSLPDYRLDPPAEYEVQCWMCGGEGKQARGRETLTIVTCESCQGTGILLLNEAEYDSYLWEMKHAD